MIITKMLVKGKSYNNWAGPAGLCSLKLIQNGKCPIILKEKMLEIEEEIWLK